MEENAEIENEERPAESQEQMDQQQPLDNEAQVPEQQPFLIQNPGSVPAEQQRTRAQKRMGKIFKRMGNFANLFPTGSVLAFQILFPVSQSISALRKVTTPVLLIFCMFFCFGLCFTDSFRDRRRKVRYGWATFQGLLAIDVDLVFTNEDATIYQIRAIDFIHAVASVFVFLVVVFIDRNVVKCFFPSLSDKAKVILVLIQGAVGVLCSLLFVRFPSRRRGIGFPLSRD